MALSLHHEWTYVFINLGLGTNASAFNLSLTPDFVNVTGRGTYCIPSLPLPVQPRDGDNATIQVVTSGKSGSALYNVGSTSVVTKVVLGGGLMALLTVRRYHLPLECPALVWR